MSNQNSHRRGITSGLSNAAGTVVVVAVFLALLVTYSALGATQHSNPWTIFAFNDRVNNSAQDKHVDISGSGNTFHGDVKSNGDLNIGATNDFNGLVRYYDEVSLSGSSTFDGIEPEQEAFSPTWPGTLGTFTEPACSLPSSTYGTRTTSGDLTLAAAAPDGVYCRGQGKILVSAEGFVGAVTLLSDQQVIVSGQTVTLTPHTDNVLMYSTSSTDDAIDWSGSNGNGTGLAFAPNGKIKVQGSNSDFCIQWAAQSVQVPGSSHEFMECLAPTEPPTEAPTQAPTEPPTQAPTEAPTEAPTQAPTEAPTQAPTEAPTQAPTEAPTEAPTQAPTEAPTQAPTEAPTQAPTEAPTQAPTEAPTQAPTNAPTNAPTDAPTDAPTNAPTDGPTSSPLGEQTTRPTPFIPDTATADPAGPSSRDAGNVIVLLIVATLAIAALMLRPVSHRRPRDPRRGT